MKVTDLSANDQITQQVQKKQTVQEPQTAGIEKGPGSTQSPVADQVNISPASRDVQKVQEVLKSTPDVRAEKVEELKQKVNSGQYKIDSQEIANKMIKSLITDLS
ncbi:MAG: flagellar biosynthesis anti-sigma factor FlgM [Pseudomonadota bacterium]